MYLLFPTYLILCDFLVAVVVPKLLTVSHPDKGGSKEEWIGLVNHFAIVTDALRKRDKGKKRRRQSNHGLLNDVHQQEIEQLKMEKLQMKKEIENLKAQIKELDVTRGSYHHGTKSTENFYDIDLSHNSEWHKRNSIY